MSSRIADSVRIHRTAIVEDGAQIGEGTVIGAYSIVGHRVRIGRGNRIGPHVVIEGDTILGDGNQVFQFASLGSQPQDLKWAGEASTLRIGDRNVFREYVTAQPGTAGGGGQTTIGNDNLFMVHAHIAHDCAVGSFGHFANSAALAGHIEVGDHVNLSGLCALHQFVRVGRHAFVSGGAMVTLDVPPFCVVQGDRARMVGLNHVGLRRAGMPQDEILVLKRAFHMLFRGAGTLVERLARSTDLLPATPSVRDLLEFVAHSPRGIVPLRRGASAD